MSLLIRCDQCSIELKEPGAILLSPPKDGLVRKIHLCILCWAWLSAFLNPKVKS